MLRVLSHTNPLYIHVWHEGTIHFSHSVHQRGTLGAELYQGSVSRWELIRIEMALNIFSETPDTPPFVSLGQSLKLIPIPRKPCNASPLNILHLLPRDKTTPRSRAVSYSLLCSLKSFTFTCILQLY